MAKFSKGDKVESVKTGAKGVVDEVYGDEKYAVLFDGATNPDRVEGFQIKAANGCARNAKFKVGDKVTDGNAVYEIMDVDDGIYEWKFVSGKADPSHSEGGEIAWAEGKMRLANSAPVRSTNAVVQNAINARRARNAGRRTFGKVVAVADDPFEDSSIFIGGGISHMAEGSTREKCLANAKALLSEYEAVVSQLKSAIAWMQSQK